ncbi:quinoprotein dehydrogenase-associated putative ABC transporter substrate-binding protein [Calidithermus roseus]|uniref:quinoprotein dehydrogenase-associated putative ABC transporter substrate-binding protein n=1 Tax=Calidithermus roseus TaxID=1644118 RepID=UPI001FE4578C|nr:quinoprotein dehydrogenase-associated putative ABC transporter substrate-binding protein [Calidithermus roseus]
MCADANGLPYSDQQQQGLDNRIAEVLAQDLGARLSYEWWPQGASTVQFKLREGHCDLIMGVGESYEGMLSTIPYYQSSFVFVYREDSPYQIETLDDEVLRRLRIAIETAGIPPFEALANRGLSEKTAILEAIDPNDRTRSPILEAVAGGEVDVAILWGPVAGYFAKRQPVKLKVVPISPEFEPPALSMVYPVTIGVRAGDEAFRDRLNIAIAHRWEQIQAILNEYGVPQVPLPAPLAQTEEEPAQAFKTLRIGLVIPTQTGSIPVSSSIYEDAGEAARRGAVLAGDELDQQAESMGMRLKVLLASAPSAEAAFRAAARLVATEGVFALIGGIGQGQAEALSRLAEQRRVLFLNIGSPFDRLRQEACGRYTFHLEASAAMYLDALAAWFARTGLRRWFVVYPDSDEGKTLYRRALEALQRHPETGEVGRAAVRPRQADYTAIVQEIRRANPQGVLLLLDAQDQLAFLGQYELEGLEAQVVAFPESIAQTRNFLIALRLTAPQAGAGYRAALWETSLQSGGAGELNARFTSRWGEPMDPPAWAAYASVKVLLEAASSNKGTGSAELVAYLEDPKTSFDLYKGVPLSFRPWDHQLRQPLYLVKPDPEAPRGIDLSHKVGLAQLVGQVPEIPPGADPVPLLDRLGDPAQGSSCRFPGEQQ